MQKKKTKRSLRYFSRRDFIRMAALSGMGLSGFGCKKSKPAPPSPPNGNTALNIKNAIVPDNIMVAPNTELSFRGSGFLVGDTLKFVLATDASQFHSLPITSTTSDSCTFLIPSSIKKGTYNISIIRGSQSMLLGTTTLSISFQNLPDKAGMSVKGTVFSAGAGLANVVVSDGIEATLTDANGVFYLPSKKEKKFLFVSIPGGYEPIESNTILPVFYKAFSQSSSTVEVIDFELKPINNNKHLLLALGDMHLANRNNDVSQFQNGFLRDADATITKYQNEGYRVYGLTLGDMTWDSYWYENNFSFSQYLNVVKAINIPVFHTMGNHDNDPYVAADWAAESSYRTALGPTYYSFNLGKIHYIVLDNIQYINTNGAQGSIGERNYTGTIISDQIAWLKKDLAFLSDKTTPIVVAMHIQLNNNPTLSGNKETATLRLTNSHEFINVFSEFSDVNLLTGHTHICYSFENGNNLMEHNSGAVCATWWWTGKNGYAGNHICKDGAPGGYGIWKFNNRDYQWLYKCIGFEEQYQFRAYDLNKVHITTARYAPNTTEEKLAPFAGPYKSPNINNEILVNVWGFDTQWKVEIFENGNPLAVTRVRSLDPLHIISYEAFRLNNHADPTADFVTTNTAHLFLARASDPTTPVEIRVTDRFGTVYTEMMRRPKDLVVSMR